MSKSRDLCVRVCGFLAVATFISTSHAVFAVNIDTVLVGNPGNPPDTTGFGLVGYAYRIGTYEVTNNQYVEFLNAKATVGDPLALYNSAMTGDAEGGILRSGAGTSGNPFLYTVKTDQGNQPVIDVSWYDTIRFANWINNGQGSSSTETGAYTLLGGTAVPSNAAIITRNAGATWFLPSENEWYKAAYYDPAAGHYWQYSTGTNGAPYSAPPPGSAAPAQSNTANYFNNDGIANSYNNGYAVTGSTTLDTSRDYLTDVGAYTLSRSPYGTLDQGGNAWEWYEDHNAYWAQFFGPTTRGFRGGSFYEFASGYVSSSASGGNDGATPFWDVGFRVATVPEPSAVGLAALGLLTVVLWRGTRKERYFRGLF